MKISRVFNEIDLFKSNRYSKEPGLQSQLSPFFLKSSEGSESFEKSILSDFKKKDYRHILKKAYRIDEYYFDPVIIKTISDIKGQKITIQ